VRDLIGTDDIEIADAVQALLIADRINSGARPRHSHRAIPLKGAKH
jgi:hypothetical protein